MNYEIIYVITNIIYLFSIHKLVHSFFDEFKYCTKKLVAFYIVGYLVISIAIFITRIPIVLFIINVILIFLLTNTFKSSLQQRVICTSMICTILLFIELVVVVSIGFKGVSPINNEVFDSLSGLILVRVTTMIVSYLFHKYKKIPKSNTGLSFQYYIAFGIILFGTLYLFFNTLENTELKLSDIIINGMVLIIVNLTMIFFDENIYKIILLQNQKKLLEEQNIAYENQFNLINQSSETIKLIRHDLKNHFIILNVMNNNNQKKEIESYIGSVIDSMDNKILSNSNNFVIDSIINFKLSTLDMTNVNINLKIIVPQTINISANDLTIILGNLLDNAIFALQKSNEKILKIKITSNLNNLMIFIDNTFDGNLIVENGKLKTTKLFKAEHGLGLISIEKVLEVYGGEMRIEYTQKTFSSSIIIPY